MLINESPLTLGSLFSGVGGFEYAAIRQGIVPIWASEIDESCLSITNRHFPAMVHLGDVKQINGSEIPPVQIITMGSPCQGYSLAGARKGMADKRSGLFIEAIRIIDEMRAATDGKYPIWAVWENVPGALSSGSGGQKGADFKTVLEAFTKTCIPIPRSGKWANAGLVRSDRASVAWRLLNSAGHGVPQRRKRIFLVANFGDGCPEEVLFIEESMFGDFAKGEEKRKRDTTSVKSGIEESGHGNKI